MDVAHEQLLASAQKGLNTGSESFVSLDARSACRWFSGRSSWTQSCFCVLGYQGHLLGDSRTTPGGITLLHFDDHMNQFSTRSFRAGLPTAIRGEQHAVLSLAHGFVKG
jgi:hypothetical protein